MESFHTSLKVNFRSTFVDTDGFATLMVRPKDIVQLWKNGARERGDITNYTDALSKRPGNIAKRAYYENLLRCGGTIVMPFITRNDDTVVVIDGRHRLIVLEKAAKNDPSILIPLFISNDTKDWFITKLKELEKNSVPPKENIISRLFKRQRPEAQTISSGRA